MEQIRLRTFEPTYGEFYPPFVSWNNGSKTYKNIQIVHDDSYTHAAVYNLYYGEIKVPKERVVGFITEPYETYNLKDYVAYADKNIGTFFCHDPTGLSNTFRGGIPFLGPIAGTNQFVNEPKTRKMSFLVSSKHFFAGHQLRHRLVRKILQSNLDIDIYGHQLEHMYRDPRVRGTIDDKRKALVPYRFTIAIENVPYPYWVTEKYYDPLMMGCVPIYWGASQINNIFSPHAHINLPLVYDENILFEHIKNIYERPQLFDHITPFIGQQILKERVNMPEFLYRYFNAT